MRALRPFVCTFCALGVATFCARGNPLGGTVVPGSGAASFSSTLGTLTIDQTTPRVIINWQDFSIRPGEVTRFIQPSAGAAALNRVISANPSELYGTLQGNGAVFLINQNGILVGPGAQINVGSFLASTLDFGPDELSANASFLSGAALRLSGNSTAAVRNEGYISALDDVFLIAHTVQNAGTISGHTVGLAAGADIELRQAGAERLAVLAGNSKATPGSTDGVVNSGNIAAVSAELKAAGGNIYALAINNGGAVRATGIVKENGRILLRADRGTVVNSGTLDASSKTPGGKGGDVKVLGERVALVGGSKIDVSGDAGGGTVLVGGDFQGKNADVPNAQRTVVGRNSTINADALSSGDGGKVIVWSDEATRYLGEISARGAGASGNGGFVEVSGKSGLTFDGGVNVAASGSGTKGTVLLDPATIRVEAAGPDINGDGTAGDDIAALTDLDAAGDFSAADSIITAGAVNALLTGNNNLVLAASVSATVNAAISGSDNASLTLDAPLVNLNAPITLAGSGVLSGTPAAVNVGTFGGIGGTQGTIQNAVDVAAAGATVIVGAGTYVENISVSKGLSLNGARGASLPGESVIRGQVRLEAPGIALNGFTVRGYAGGAGIVANNASGDVIINNYITDNVFGLSLASGNGAVIRVENNLFENNTRPGSASGNGLYTDFAVFNVWVSGNRFVGHPEGSVTFLGPSSSIQISGNTIVGDGPISLGNVSGVSFITRNSISGNSGHAIWIGGGVTGLSITENRLHDNGGAGVKFARPGSSGIAAVSSGFTVRENSFQNNADGAIVIDTTEGSRYTGVLNASGNWWGNARGPQVVSSGFTGSGNNIDAIHITDLNLGPERVDFSPWLNSDMNDVDITMAPGFLGDLTVLNVSPLSPKATADTFIGEALTAPFNLTQRLQLFAGNYGGAAEANPATITIPVAVVLKGDVTLAAGTSVSFGSTVDTDGTPWTLDVTSPSLTLGGAVGNAAPGTELGRLAASGSAGINGGIVKTRTGGLGAGNQTYSGAVTLGADTVLTASTVTFENTVNGTTLGTESLTINGNAVFGNGAGDLVGNLFALDFLDVSGTTALNGGSVTTVNAQDYDGAVTLGANTTLNNSTVTFGNGIIGAGRDLTLNSSQDVTLNGPAIVNVGTFRTTAPGRTILNGGSLVANTLIDIGDNLSLGANTTLTAPAVTLAGVTGNSLNLDVAASGLTVFGGAVSGVNTLTTDAQGTTRISAPSITTAGSQTYRDMVVLAADTVLTGPTISFENTVNGTTAGNESLTLNGDAVFGNGADDFVGNTVALQFVDVSGTTTLNAGNAGSATVRTTGAQDYDGPVLLVRDTTLTGSAITFGNSVDGAVAGNQSLNIVGNLTFVGAVGGTRSLEFVDVTGSAALNGPSVTTASSQDYDGAVTLGRDTTLTGTAITFGSTVNGTVAGNESLNIVGGATFAGAVGNTRSLEFVDVTGNATLNGGTVRTTGRQDYDGAVTLGLDTTLTGSAVTFGSTVNAAAAGIQFLNIAGNAVFGGAVGTGMRLEFVDVDGTTALNGGEVVTTGRQDYDGAATLGRDTTLTGSMITFGNLVDGTTPDNESLNIVGNATFRGAVGNSAPLELLEVTATTALNGGSVATAGPQNYNGAVTLGLDTALTGSAITFGSTVDGTATGTESLSIAADAIFGGAVGTTRSLELIDVTGTTAFNGGAVTTAGAQDYHGAATLGANAILTASRVTFDSTVNAVVSGLQGLRINGDAVLGDFVGNVMALEHVNVSGSATFNAGNMGGTIPTVRTSGDQTYTGPATLGANGTFTGSRVTFGNTVDGTTADAQSLAINGNGQFGGAVGNGTRLTSVDISGTADLNGGTVQTLNGQNYHGAATLGANATLTGSRVFFGSTVDGAIADAQSLAIVGNGQFEGAVGNNARLTSVDVSGTVALNGGTVQTLNAQDYDGAATLGAHATLTGSRVTFGSTVNGASADAQSLAIVGNGQFGGAVGNNARLTSVDVSGTTALNGGTVQTAGDQNYHGTVTLGVGTTLSAGGQVTLAGVTGGGQDLRVTAVGETTFSQAVSGVRALVSDGGGNTVIQQTINAASVRLDDTANLNGGTVTTSGNQDYNGTVTLGVGTTLSAGGAVTLAGVTGGGQDLRVSAAGETTFNQAVNGVGALWTDAGGNTVINQTVSAGSVRLDDTANLNGVTVTTTGDQNYNGAVTLGVGPLGDDVTLAGARVNFGSTVNALSSGQQGLQINGDAVFGNAAGDFVGNVTALEFVNVSGSVTFNAGNVGNSTVRTIGDQTYSGPMILGAGTTLTALGTPATGGKVTLAGVIGGGQDLRVTAAGDTTFNQDVFGVGALVSDGGGNTVINQTVSAGSVTLQDTVDLNGASITTSGGQTYDAAVTLGGDDTLPKTLSGGGITFGSTITGADHDLNVNASGDVLLRGGVELGGLSILSAQNINYNGDAVDDDAVTRGTLTVGKLVFCANGRVAFVNPDNVIGNVDLDSAGWQATDGFVVVDSATAQFFTGKGKGTAEATPFDASLQRLIASLVPQVQFQEIQASLGGEVSGELQGVSGILTRSTKIHFKVTEALTRSGEVGAGKPAN
jgi:mucin-19